MSEIVKTKWKVIFVRWYVCYGVSLVQLLQAVGLQGGQGGLEICGECFQGREVKMQPAIKLG